MREIRSYGAVGVPVGNHRHYPANTRKMPLFPCVPRIPWFSMVCLGSVSRSYLTHGVLLWRFASRYVRIWVQLYPLS